MAAANIITIGTTATSVDVTVAAGATLGVSLKGPPDDKALVTILLKDDAGAYNKIDTLTKRKPAVAIVTPGVYRFTRKAGGSCGVFSG